MSVEKPQNKRTRGGHMRIWQSDIEKDVRKIRMRILTGFNWPRIGTSERLLYIQNLIFRYHEVKKLFSFE
jgi:hypothetical protein